MTDSAHPDQPSDSVVSAACSTTALPTCPRCGVTLPTYGSHSCQPTTLVYPQLTGQMSCAICAMDNPIGAAAWGCTQVGLLWVCGSHVERALGMQR